jgi:hypothetical protein
LRGSSSRALANAILVAVPVLTSACAGSGSSHTTQPSASSVALYCDDARRLRTQGENLYIALRKAAPTNKVRNDIESVLALNDANHTHFHGVETYTLNTCGVDLPRYGG